MEPTNFPHQGFSQAALCSWSSSCIQNPFKWEGIMYLSISPQNSHLQFPGSPRWLSKTNDNHVYSRHFSKAPGFRRCTIWSQNLMTERIAGPEPVFPVPVSKPRDSKVSSSPLRKVVPVTLLLTMQFSPVRLQIVEAHPPPLWLRITVPHFTRTSESSSYLKDLPQFPEVRPCN